MKGKGTLAKKLAGISFGDFESLNGKQRRVRGLHI